MPDIGGWELRFPEGRTKALSLSYDDGSEHDRRLVALLDAYGLAATFHLTSSTLGAPHRVGRGEVARLYARHEVACHGATHTSLTELDDDAVRRELCDDRAALEDLTGRPVRGLAYPFGHHDARIEALAAAVGFAYGRGITDSHDFALPAEPMRLTTSCHHNEAMMLGRQLLASDGPDLKWMRVRGHSFELDGFLSADPAKDWQYMAAFCRMMGGDPSIWHAPLLAVLDYLAAAQHVRLTPPGHILTNGSPLAVWLADADGKVVEVPANAVVSLAATPTGRV